MLQGYAVCLVWVSWFRRAVCTSVVFRRINSPSLAAGGLAGGSGAVARLGGRAAGRAQSGAVGGDVTRDARAATGGRNAPHLSYDYDVSYRICWRAGVEIASDHSTECQYQDLHVELQ